MTLDEKRNSLDKWREWLKRVGTEVRKGHEKTIKGFGKIAENLRQAGG